MGLGHTEGETSAVGEKRENREETIDGNNLDHLQSLKDGIMAGNIEAVKAILRKDATLAAAKFGDKQGTAVRFTICEMKGSEEEKLAMLKGICEASDKVDTDMADKLGRTALHHAVYREYPDMVAWLLADRQCKPDILDDDEVSPLISAITMEYDDESQQLKLVEALLNGGADPNRAGSDDRTPLHKAAYRDNLPLVRLLYLYCSKGLITDPRDISGETPLHDAAAQGLVDMVKLLIEYGADIEATSKEGRTPLHQAASKGKLEAVKALLDAGARTLSYSNALQTPEMLAQEGGYHAVVNALRQKRQRTIEVNNKKLLISVPLPKTPQRDTSEVFLGLIWPPVDGSDSPDFETPTVWDMLYQGNTMPKLEGLFGRSKWSSPKSFWWVHVPANNVSHDPTRFRNIEHH